MKKPLLNAARILQLMVIACMMAGCGFQLRGQDLLHSSLSHLWVSGLEGEEFRQVLVTRLEKSGVYVEKSADLSLILLDQNSDKRISAYSARAKVAGYELRKSLKFKVRDNEHKRDLLPETELMTRRQLLFRDDQVMGKQDEEQVLMREMDQELAERITRKLETLNVQDAR